LYYEANSPSPFMERVGMRLTILSIPVHWWQIFLPQWRAILRQKIFLPLSIPQGPTGGQLLLRILKRQRQLSG